MPWVKIDDHFDEHPKLVQVGPLGWGVWLAGLAYCNRNLTDGFIPNGVAARFTAGHRGADKKVHELVRLGVWDECDGGFLVHDYQDFQPTKAQVLAERQQKRSAGRAGGLAAAKARAQAESKPVPVPEPVPEPPGLPNSSTTTEIVERVRKLLYHFDNRDLTAALSVLHARLSAGEQITSPLRWTRAVATSMQETREASERANEPKVQTIDGVEMRYDNGKWEEA